MIAPIHCLRRAFSQYREEEPRWSLADSELRRGTKSGEARQLELHEQSTREERAAQRERTPGLCRGLALSI